MGLLRIRTTWLAAAFYGVLAIGLLAPMASNTVLPNPPEHASHVAMIVQARMAREQGQFPIRVAPWQHRAWLYPLYQFYSPAPYTVAGAIYRWVTPENPFLAYKLLLWAALVAGAVFVALSASLLTGSPAAAFMAGVAYMTAPYVLVNVHARGAFTEAVAQGLVPIVLYGCLRAWRSTSIAWVLTAGIGWSLLALTHLITWLASTLFLGLFFALLTIAGVRRRDAGAWRAGACVAASIAVGGLLALYFLAPVVSADYLLIRDQFQPVIAASFLTPLTSLLSPVALAPEPLPDPRLVPHFTTSIGWPLLLGVAVALWASASRTETNDEPNDDPFVARSRAALLVLFGIALFVTWSPFDFWRFLPRSAQVVQFSYRFLSQVGWIGALLVAFAMRLVCRGDPDRRETMAGVLLLIVACGSFLPESTKAVNEIAWLMRNPDIGWGQETYLFNPKRVLPEAAAEPIIPVEKMPPYCARASDAVNCHFVVTERPILAQLPILFYPNLLDITVNGRESAYVPLLHALPDQTYVLASLKLDPGTYDVTARFRGLRWANWTSAIAWIATILALVMRVRRRA